MPPRGKVVDKYAALLVLLFCFLGECQRLDYEQTDSFAVVMFSWTGVDCRNVYSLECTTNSVQDNVTLDGFRAHNGSSNCFSMVFGFAANTSYNCNMSNGISFSALVSFTTLTRVPSQPENLMFCELTWSSMKLHWDPPTINQGVVEGYNIRVSSTSRIITISSILNTIVTVTSLTPTTGYIATVRALYRNSLGVQEQGPAANVSFSTPSDALRNVRSLVVTSSTAFIVWSPPTTAVHLITEYNLEILSPFSSSLRTSNTYYNLTGLRSFTYYVMRLSASTGSGSQPQTGTTISFTTASATNGQLPSQPSIQTVFPSQRRETTAFIAWSSSIAPSEFDVSYYPLYTFSNSASSLQRLTLSGVARNVSISGLNSRLTYRVELRAVNSAGSGRVANQILPPYLAVPEAKIVQSRRNYIQLLLSDASNCSRWQMNLEINRLGQGLFDRLITICPSCNNFLPRSNFLKNFRAFCSGSSSQVLFTAELSGTGKCSECNFNSVLEFLVALPNPHIVAAGSVLLIDPNCPLYTSFPSGSSCTRSSSSAVAAVAGGTIGGIIAGAILASAIAAILLLIAFIYLRKKHSKDDLPPHPTTTKVQLKSMTDDGNVAGEEYYEDIPMFGQGPMQSFEANYEDPSKVCRPNNNEVTASSGYEIPDYGQQTNPNNPSKGKVAAGNKDTYKPKKSKSSKKKSKNTQSIEGGTHQPPAEAATPQMANMYSNNPLGTASLQPQHGQEGNPPQLPVGGKKLAVPSSGTGGRRVPNSSKPKPKEKPVSLKTNPAYHTHLKN